MSPFRVFRRLLSTKTTLNPSSISFNYPDTRHQSLIVLTTPSQLNNVIKKSVDDFQNSQLRPISQVVVACVDSILNSRDAYSELYLKSNLNIKSFKSLDQFNNEQKVSKFKRDPLSVDPIKFDKNWLNNSHSSSLNISINNSSSVSLNLANTLFVNDESCTCFFVNESESDWQNLINLSVEINDKELNNNCINYSNKLIELPLEEGSDINKVFKVTDYEGNLIKSINDNPASGYLINNSLVMDSKKELYFKLFNKDLDLTRPWEHQYYKLIVGGLGWGEKQAFLGVDPIVGQIGHRFIKLFQYNDKKNPENKSSYSELLKNRQDALIFECSEVEHGYGSHHEHHLESNQNNEISLPGIFGAGCEQGFTFNGIWHGAQGDTLELLL